MTISLDLPKQILKAQTKARKPENIKNEDVGGMLITLKIQRRLGWKSWIPVRMELYASIAGVGYPAMKRVARFGKRGKLNPRYVGLFKVLKKVRAIAYKHELPQELSRVHNTFHVSNLKKCYSDDPLVILLEGLQVDDKLHFVEEPVEVMDREVKQLRGSRVPIVKDIEEDPEEELEDDDDDMEMDDEAEVIDPYMDDGSNNPPPPNSEDEETPPTSPVIPDADGQPIPPIASFGQNFHFGESSSTGNLLTGNSKIVPIGPMCPNLGMAWK
nr:putative reverse transcriptase domain-containing protein [Tanacetum cinerariifolium]